MEWERKLLAVPPDEWKVEQVIALDWHDGPRSGLCALSNPVAEFVFELVDEERDPDGLDLRVVQLRELPAGTVASFSAELQQLGPGPATKPVWAPIWRFPSRQARCQADSLVQSLQVRSRLTDLMIATTDMVTIQKCWHATPAHYTNPLSKEAS
jgi:hypothetical protein